MASAIDHEILKAYLAESLPPEEMARVEKALRQSSELRAELEDVRQGRVDSSLHSLGAIWRRGRLSCPDRQQLGSYLLDALEPQLTEYIAFHIEVIECPFCHANLADLKAKTALTALPSAQQRRQRFFHSSRKLLPEGER